MTRFLKWAALAVLVLAIAGFVTFLYMIPPFFTASPETFAAGLADAPPSVGDIADPAERAIAERGRYIVQMTPCIGCHQMPGPQGPLLDKYLAGGAKFTNRDGVFVSRNLTPDPETGLGRRSDAEIARVLRSGVLADGHVASHAVMPWASFSNWTDEDRHAVVVYLRHLKPVRHTIPGPGGPEPSGDPAAVEEDYGLLDYGTTPK